MCFIILLFHISWHKNCLSPYLISAQSVWEDSLASFGFPQISNAIHQNPGSILSMSQFLPCEMMFPMRCVSLPSWTVLKTWLFSQLWLGLLESTLNMFAWGSVVDWICSLLLYLLFIILFILYILPYLVLLWIDQRQAVPKLNELN